MVEGLYRGWDELRSVPAGSQSGLRVIVLFTDGASNSVPGDYGSGPGVGAANLRLPAESRRHVRPDLGQPHITGLYDTQTGANRSVIDTQVPWNSHQHAVHREQRVAEVPAGGERAHPSSQRRHPGHVSAADRALTVDGLPQSATRGLRNFDAGAGKYPAEVFNINNAARNLVEIIANAARNDVGDYRIRIYTIGMGQLVPLQLGTRMETSESILKRMANDSILSGLQQRAARRQVLLRPDGRRRRPRVSAIAEPDPAFEQVVFNQGGNDGVSDLIRRDGRSGG